jgi:hypothetical protein
MGRPNKALMISEADRPQLRSLVRSQSMPHSWVRRAQCGARRSCCCRMRASPIGEVARRCGGQRSGGKPLAPTLQGAGNLISQGVYGVGG